MPKYHNNDIKVSSDNERVYFYRGEHGTSIKKTRPKTIYCPHCETEKNNTETIDKEKWLPQEYCLTKSGITRHFDRRASTFKNTLYDREKPTTWRKKPTISYKCKECNLIFFYEQLTEKRYEIEKKEEGGMIGKYRDAIAELEKEKYAKKKKIVNLPAPTLNKCGGGYPDP